MGHSRHDVRFQTHSNLLMLDLLGSSKRLQQGNPL